MPPERLRARVGGRPGRYRRGGHPRLPLRRNPVRRLTAGERDTEELAKARAELATVRREHDDLADKVAAGKLSATLAARAEPGILKRLRAAEARERELSTPAALSAGPIRPGKDVRRRWKAAAMPARREVARLLLTREVLGELRVTRRHTNGPTHVPAHERIVWQRS
jgi:site-specific DNA recombinase